MAKVQKQYLTFELDGQRFAFETTNVKDLLNKPNIVKVSLADADVLGILNLRGNVITCLDLKKKLNASSDKPISMMIISEYEEFLYGFNIDRVLSVVNLSDSDIQNVPSNLNPEIARYATGIFYYMDNSLVTILSQDLLFEQYSSKNVANLAV